MLAKRVYGGADRNRTRFFFAFITTLSCAATKIKFHISNRYYSKTNRNTITHLQCHVKLHLLGFHFSHSNLVITTTLTIDFQFFFYADKRPSHNQILVFQSSHIYCTVKLFETIIFSNNLPFINKQKRFTSTGTRGPGDSMMQILSMKSSLTVSNRYIWRLELKWDLFAP